MKGIIASVSGLFSSACCVGPALLTGLGVGASTAGFLGGVAGFVKMLIPFQFFLIALALGTLGLQFYTVYGPKRKACANNSLHSAKKLKKEKYLLWTNTIVIIFFILSPYILAIG